VAQDAHQCSDGLKNMALTSIKMVKLMVLLKTHTPGTEMQVFFTSINQQELVFHTVMIIKP
jgi:hypothetical protein